MKIIATIKRSAGNETVGDMWHETAMFDDTQPISDVFMWIEKRIGYSGKDEEKYEYAHTRNVTLSICQDQSKEPQK